MFKTKYLIRLDDACPTMDKKKWDRMESILDDFSIKPMVGIVPNNQDDNLMVDKEDAGFWDKVHNWVDKGWTLALHGYDHCYISNEGMFGINPMWSFSEFSGVPLEKQKEKIKNGLDIIHKKGLETKYFFAPGHTFDNNTLIAIREESSIRMISDTIGRYPYWKDDILFIPQIVGHAVQIPLSGLYTFCYHPNMMREEDFNRLIVFLQSHSGDFIGFEDINGQYYKTKRMFDKFLSFLFFKYRCIRKINN